MNKQEFLHIKDFLLEFARRVLFSELKGPIIHLNVNIQVNNVVNHNNVVNNNYAQVYQDERKLIQENQERMRRCV